MCPTSSAPLVGREASTSRNSVAVTSPVLFGMGDFYVRDDEPEEIRGIQNTLLGQVDAMAIRSKGYFAGLDFDRSKMACANAAILLCDKSGRVEKRTPRLQIIRIPFPRRIQGALRVYCVRLCPWFMESRIFDIVCSFRIRYYFHTRCIGMVPNYAIRRDPRSGRNRRYSGAASANSRKPRGCYHSHRCAGAPRRLYHLDTGGDKAMFRHVQKLRRRRAG